MIEPIFLCSKAIFDLKLNTSVLAKQVYDNKNNKEEYDSRHTFAEDNFYPETPEGDALIAAIDKQLHNKICPTMTTWTKWGHIMEPGESTAPHSHVGDTINGLSWVYYLDTPENCGDLVFMSNFDGRTIINYVKPKKNRLVVFPDFVMHYTLKNNSDKPRISVSGNAKPDNEAIYKKGDFGNLFNMIGIYENG